MTKIFLGCVCIMIMNACSYFAINGMMCEQIASDPFSTIPSECRPYSQAKAQKASRAPSDILAPDDLLIYQKKN